MTDDDYHNLDPEEVVTMVGLGPMSLQNAVQRYIKASRTSGALMAAVLRDAGKHPPTFDVNHLDRMAEMDWFDEPAVPPRGYPPGSEGLIDRTGAAGREG